MNRKRESVAAGGSRYQRDTFGLISVHGAKVGLFSD